MQHGFGFMEVMILPILVLVGFSVGMMCASFLERRLRSIRGQPSLFSSYNALVIVDADGLSIEGLGNTPWAEVIGCQGIADSDTSTLVYTRRYCQIVLHERPSILVPVIDYYLNSERPADQLLE